MQSAEGEGFDPTSIATAVRDAGFSAERIDVTAVGTVVNEGGAARLEMTAPLTALRLRDGTKTAQLKERRGLLQGPLRLTGRLEPAREGQPALLALETWEPVDDGSARRDRSDPRWQAEASPPAIGELEMLASPAGPKSGQPQLHRPQEGRVILSWLEPGASAKTRLRFAERDGSGWSAPRTVVDGEEFFVNWADVPSVVRLADGRLAAHWLNKSGPSTYAYDVRLRISDDGGGVWSSALTPHRDGTLTEHGFASLFDWAPGGLGLVWLDGREMSAESGPGRDDRGSITLRATTLSPDLEFAPEVLLDGRVCECCPTAAVQTDQGVVVAYRDRSDEEVRDIATVRYHNGSWSDPVIVHRDGWQIRGCPVNGPALASDGQIVALAWFTAEAGDGRVQVAFSQDAGASFGRPIRISSDVALGRVDLTLLPDRSALVTWIGSRAGTSEFLLRRVARSGEMGAPRSIVAIDSSRASGVPRLVRSGDELVFAWTETGAVSRVRTAVAALVETKVSPTRSH